MRHARAMMRSLAALALLLMLQSCASAPTFEQASAHIPPPPAGAARVFIYRDFEPYQSLSWVPVFLNGANTGAVGPGRVLMRDVAPGTYTIEALSQGLWPNQAKTVTVAPGQTVYAKVESFKSANPTADRFVPQTTFVVVLMDTATGEREIAPLWLQARRQKGPAVSG
jgi:hypothetical protein